MDFVAERKLTMYSLINRTLVPFDQELEGQKFVRNHIIEE